MDLRSRLPEQKNAPVPGTGPGAFFLIYAKMVCTKNMYSKVPPKILSRLLCFHRCKATTAAIDTAWGIQPAAEVKEIPFRQ